MKKYLLILMLYAVSAISIPVLAKVTVIQDRENVAASRLAGAWAIDPGLSEKLTGSDSSRVRRVTFTSDPSIGGKIPEKYDKFLADKTVYMAGMMTLEMKSSKKKFPFILIQHHGNPYIVFFRPRGGDPLGDAESFNIMLARGEGEDRDLLFIGGDFNNQAFVAFERISAK